MPPKSRQATPRNTTAGDAGKNTKRSPVTGRSPKTPTKGGEAKTPSSSFSQSSLKHYQGSQKKKTSLSLAFG